MRPTINNTTFGSINVEGTIYNHDIIIRSNGRVEKRKKKLSKAIYGSSHTVSLAEIEYSYDPEATKLIIGNGQYGALKLSDEAIEFLNNQQCAYILAETPKAIEVWNTEKGQAAGLFHITC
jgi:hypothetical protein